MQRLVVNGAVRHIYIYVIRRLRVKLLSLTCSVLGPLCSVNSPVSAMDTHFVCCTIRTESIHAILLNIWPVNYKKIQTVQLIHSLSQLSCTYQLSPQDAALSVCGSCSDANNENACCYLPGQGRLLYYGTRRRVTFFTKAQLWTEF
jgi:hypothetical protein